jgi:hypothetical protein
MITTWFLIVLQGVFLLLSIAYYSAPPTGSSPNVGFWFYMGLSFAATFTFCIVRAINGASERERNKADSVSDEKKSANT